MPTYWIMRSCQRQFPRRVERNAMGRSHNPCYIPQRANFSATFRSEAEEKFRVEFSLI